MVPNVGSVNKMKSSISEWWHYLKRRTYISEISEAVLEAVFVCMSSLFPAREKWRHRNNSNIY